MSVLCERILQTLEKMGIRADVEERSITELSIPYVNIITDDARFLIGARARYLLALEYLLKRFMERETGPEAKGFFLDVNGYRLHQLEELRAEARQVARRVRLYRTELILEPMPPFERRVVHMALAEYPDITTQSTGDGPSRRVVIKPYP